MAHHSPLNQAHTAAGAAMHCYGPDDLGIAVVQAFGQESPSGNPSDNQAEEQAASQAQNQAPNQADGRIELEYAAIRRSVALFDLPHRGTLEITGDDRLTFLNNMVTNGVAGETASLAPGQSTRAFWLSRKGRITGDLRITELGTRLIIDVDALAAPETRETLDAYLITEDAEIKDITQDVHRLALHGPTGPLLLDAVLDPDDTKPAIESLCDLSACDLSTGNSFAGNLSATERMCRGIPVLIERCDTTGTIGLELTVATEYAADIYRVLIAHGQLEPLPEPVAAILRPEPSTQAEETASRVRLRPAGWLAYNMARIEAGTPLFNIDFGSQTLPHETGPETLASRVSFTKGCYLGQEVVSRMHHLGKPKQQLVALRPSGPELRDEHGMARQPVGGTQIFRAGDLGGEAIGAVTSSTISPMLGGDPVCFAMVKQAVSEPGTVLALAAEGAPVEAAVLESLRTLA